MNENCGATPKKRTMADVIREIFDIQEDSKTTLRNAQRALLGEQPEKCVQGCAPATTGSPCVEDALVLIEESAFQIRNLARNIEERVGGF